MGEISNLFKSSKMCLFTLWHRVILNHFFICIVNNGKIFIIIVSTTLIFSHCLVKQFCLVIYLIGLELKIIEFFFKSGLCKFWLFHLCFNICGRNNAQIKLIFLRRRAFKVLMNKYHHDNLNLYPMNVH